MHDALTALARAAADATSTPTPSMVDPDLVTPGPWGFVIIALVGVAVILLVWDMMRRIRRGRVRADINEELDELEAEQKAADERGDGDTDDGSGRPRGAGRIDGSSRGEGLLPPSKRSRSPPCLRRACRRRHPSRACRR